MKAVSVMSIILGRISCFPFYVLNIVLFCDESVNVMNLVEMRLFADGFLSLNVLVFKA